MKYERVLVVGGTGFVGTHIVHKLVQAGHRVTVPTRRRERAKHLALLPGVTIVQTSVHDDAAIAQLLVDQDAVVSLVGILHGRSGQPAPYGPDFAKAHVELPKRLADACVLKGIRRFIQISALGVTADGKRNLPSRYLRSKAAGERSLRDTLGLDLTILRPSVVFGREDKFLNLFAQMQAIAPFMPMPRAGAKFQPVWVEDFARAVLVCLEKRITIGKVYDLVGPKVYTLAQLVQLSGQYAGHERPVFGLPDVLGRLQATLVEFMPGGPLMSRDNFDSMTVDNVSLLPLSADFGFAPTSLESIAPTYLDPQLSVKHNGLRSRAGR